MDRKGLIERICPNDAIDECVREDCESNCNNCEVLLNALLDEYDKQIRADMLKDVIEIVKSIKKTKWHWKESFSNETVYEEFVDYDELIDSLEHIADADKKIKESEK